MKTTKYNGKRMGLFFDPKRPAMPETVMGYESSEILKVAYAAGNALLYSPYKYKKKISESGISGYDLAYSAADVLRIAPLLGRVVAGEQLKPGDVRPYRKAIKGIVRRHSPKFGMADRLCAATSILGVGVLARRALNRRVEREFIERAPSLMRKMRNNINILEPYVAMAECIDNPRTAVQSEIAFFADMLRDGSRHWAYCIGAKQVSSMDVAVGATHIVDTVYDYPTELAEKAPLTHELLTNIELGPRPRINLDILAVAAPEIVGGLDRCLPEAQRDPEFLRQVTANPSPKRGLALMFKSDSMNRLEEVAYRVLPNAVQCLPTNGSSVRVAYDRLQQFLGVAS